jgi:ATP-dependent protease HslVU (ClpYQ) peptidase subunit
MTTIAWDGRTLAGDGRRTADDVIVTDTAIKVHRVGNALVGYAGVCSLQAKFLEWVEKGGDWPFGKDPDFTGLVIRNGKAVMYLDENPDECPTPWAIGSGRHAALAAMRAGADAAKAVEIAKTMDVFTGGTVTAVQPE